MKLRAGELHRTDAQALRSRPVDENHLPLNEFGCGRSKPSHEAGVVRIPNAPARRIVFRRVADETGRVATKARARRRSQRSRALSR